MSDEIEKKMNDEPSLSTFRNKRVVIPLSSKHGTQRLWNPKNIYTLSPCPDCEFMVQNAQAMMRHRVEVHGFVPNFKCDLCGVILTHTEEINAHKANHEKEKTEECPICHEKFTTDTSVIRHMKYKHTYERNYKCYICDKSFVEHYNLQIHIRQHTGEAPFSCNKCEAVFRTKISLKRHSVTHSSVREYICILCFQQFGICNTLRQHMKKIHLVENIHHNGVKNSKMHGIPKTMHKYLLAAGKKLEDFGRIKYYALKEECESQLQKYFRQVSPLLLNGKVDKNVLNFIPESSKPKKEKALGPSIDRASHPQTGRPTHKLSRPIKNTVDESDETTGQLTEIPNKQMNKETEIETEMEECCDKDELVETTSQLTEIPKYQINEETEIPTQMEECCDKDESVETTGQLTEIPNKQIKKESKIQTQIAECSDMGKLVEITGQHAEKSNKQINTGTEIQTQMEECSDKEESVGTIDQHVEKFSVIKNKTSDTTTPRSQCTTKDIFRDDVRLKGLTDENVQALLRRIFIPLEDRELQRMKEGQFGKNPTVIQVLDDGTAMDITEDYTAYSPSV